MAIDPITVEVLRSALPAITNEMSHVLRRTSYNMMIYEVGDYCCSILDTEGNLISQNAGGVSHFVSDLGVVIRDGVERIKDFAPGGRRDHEPSARLRPAPQQHLRLHPVLLRGQTARLRRHSRALDRRRRLQHRFRRRRRDRPVARRTAAQPIADLPRGAWPMRACCKSSPITSASRSRRWATCARRSRRAISA